MLDPPPRYYTWKTIILDPPPRYYTWRSIMLAPPPRYYTWRTIILDPPPRYHTWRTIILDPPPRYYTWRAIILDPPESIGKDEMAPQSGMTSLDFYFCLFGGAVALWMLLRASWFVWFKVRVHILSEYWKAVDFSHYGTWAGFQEISEEGRDRDSFCKFTEFNAYPGILPPNLKKAFKLAKKGFDIVLVSRSMEKLKQVAAEIELLYGRSTKVIQADFTGGSEIYESIQEALQGLEIGVLVNNVGMAHTMPSEFLQTPDLKKYIGNLVNCNILSTVKMTEAILPQMVARKKGIIINICSASAWKPIPLAAVYSASKAFMDVFSQVLNVEYRSKGIIVQSILPILVDTNMARHIKLWTPKISPEVFAHKALNTVGFTSRTTGSLFHSLQRNIENIIFPPSLLHTTYGMWIHRNMTKALFK
ncbi:very-long-chain 3-oxoacyl-CoA reductase-like [Anolis sagrei]|uniref:very-long-chain 3-oxoacyl-CoA reductase-like n=1 Tax=Anolis sagrei TaxID=38937 RepID=UPI00352183BB